jgi:uncharacterized protein YcfL
MGHYTIISRIIIILISLIFLLNIFNCGSTYHAKNISRPPLEETDKVIYKNWDLKKSVGIVDVNQDYVNGLLRARLRIKNLTGKIINTEIKVKFRDAQGFEMSEIPWTPLPLQSGEIHSFEQIATNKEAVDFRIVIQRAGSHRGEGN